MKSAAHRAAAPAPHPLAAPAEAPPQAVSPRGPAHGIAIARIAKRYGDTRVLREVSLHVRPGEFLSLLGPSGCGKTTLLRILAGLVRPDEGSVHFGEQAVTDAAAGRHVPAEQRNVGMVFQDYALWPHLRVEQNVAFPLEARKTVPRAQHAARVRRALQRVGLAHLAGRHPEELSGGQQQRVALARAIVAEPRVVLFDEPLSNLDAGLRETLGREMAALVRELGLTAVYVTHDQSEALALSDRIAVMRAGEIVQHGSPESLYHAPADAWVAEFLNAGSLLRGEASGSTFTAPGLSIPLAQAAIGQGTLLIPAAAVQATDAGGIELRVASSQFRGERYEIHAAPPGSADGSLRFWSPDPLAPGSTVRVALDGTRLRFYGAPAPAIRPLSFHTPD